MSGRIRDSAAAGAPFGSFLQPPEQLVEKLAASQRPVLFTHVYPDGDGVGSQLGLLTALRSRGAKPRICNPHPAPDKFRFLDPDGVVEVVPDLPGDDFESDLSAADLLVVLDTSDPGRLGRLREFVSRAAVPCYVVDHHLCHHHDAFDFIWSEPDSPSTGNMVLRIIQELGVSISPQIATPLFVAISTDTGWFRFANATREAYWGAGQLAAAGANPEHIHSELFETSTVVRTRVLGELLAGLQSDEHGRIIYGVLREESLSRHGLDYEEIDGFIDSLKSVRGAEILFLVVELSQGRYKVSLRSKGGWNVHQIAARFGGGGHAKAAGCRLQGDEGAVVRKVLEVAREVLSGG